MRIRPATGGMLVQTVVEENQGDEAAVPQDPRAYKLGDEVNGHVLGADNVWHALPPNATLRPIRGYWKRYRGRWRKTYLVLAVFGVLTTLSSSKAGGLVLFLDILGAATISAAIIASPINLLVAAFPDRTQPKKEPSTG